MGNPENEQKVNVLSSVISNVESHLGWDLDREERGGIGFLVHSKWEPSVTSEKLLAEIGLTDQTKGNEAAELVRNAVYESSMRELERQIEAVAESDPKKVLFLQELRKFMQDEQVGVELLKQKNPNAHIPTGTVPHFWLPEWAKPKF